METKAAASANGAIRVGIRDFRKLQGSSRLDALEETLPHLMRAALFSQDWMKLSLLGKTSQVGTGAQGGTKSLSGASEDVDYVIEGEIVEVDERRIRADFTVRDVLRRSVVLRDFVYFDDSQIIPAMTQVTTRLASALREKVLSASAGQRLVVMVGPFENSIPDPKLKFLDASLPLSLSEGSKSASTSSLIFRSVLGTQQAVAAEPWDIRVTGKISLNADSIVVAGTYQERTGLSLPIEHSGPAAQPLEVVDFFAKKVWEVLKARVRPEGGFQEEPALFANPTAQKLFGLAADYEKKSNFDAAIFMYRAAIAKQQNYADARLRLAELYLQRESYTLAESEFKELLQLDNRNARAHLGLGTVYSKQARYEPATKELQQTLALAASDAKLLADIYVRMGDVALLQNQADKSIEYYSKAIGTAPASPAPFLALAKAYRAKNDLTAAIENSKKGLTLWPNDADLKNDLATSYNASGQQRYDAKEYPAALDFYKKTIELDPPDVRLKATAYLQTGVTLGWKMDDYKQAIAYLEKAVQLRPDDELNHRTLGVAYQNLERYTDSVTELQKALSILATYDGYTDLAYSYMLMNDYDRGTDAAKKALEFDTSKWRAYALLGANYEFKYLANKGDDLYQPAEDNLKIAAQKNPENEAIYRLLGILYQKKAENEKALAAFQQAIKIRPTAEAYALLVEVYETQKKPAEAIAAILEGLKLDRRREDFYESLSRLYQQTQQSEKFIELLKQTTQDDPKYVTPYIRLGRASRVQGKYDEAIQWLEKAIALDPKNEWAVRLMGLTYSSMGQKNKNDRAAYDKAVQYLNQSIALSPTQWSYTELGKIYSFTGENQKAIDNLLKAIQVDAQYEDAYDLLGPLLDHAHRSLDFVALLENAAAKDAKNTWARQKLVDRYLDMGRNDEAIQHAAALIQLDPQDVDAYFKLSSALRAKHELDKAYLSAKKAVEIAPTNANAIWMVNSVLLDQKQYAKALDELQINLQKNPDSPMVYALMGNTSRLAKDYPKASEYTRKAISLAPNYSWAIYILGQTYFDTGKIPEALDSAKEALKKNGELWEAINLMRDANHELKKDPDTITYLEQLLATKPNSIQLLNSIGFISSEYTKDYQKAYETFGKAFELTPENPTIANNFAEANLLTGHLDAVVKLSSEVLALPNTSFQSRLNMKLLQIAAYLLQGDQGKAFAELGAFRDDYSKVPKDYERRLKFEGLKNFFSTHAGLKAPEKNLLLRMIDLLEASPEEAGAKLSQFEASFTQFFRDLKATASTTKSGTQ